MFIGTIKNNISIQGYIDKGLLDPTYLYQRHHELVIEMSARKMNHKSPLPTIILEKKWIQNSLIDVGKNIRELCYRCKDCQKQLYEQFILKQCKYIEQ
jgi:uncharacterized membrane protein YcaP (DUF421 family)